MTFKVKPDAEIVTTTNWVEEGGLDDDPRMFNWDPTEITHEYAASCGMMLMKGRPCRTCRARDIAANVIRRSMRRAGVVVSAADLAATVSAIGTLLRADRSLDDFVILADTLGLPKVQMSVIGMIPEVMEITATPEQYRAMTDELDKAKTIETLKRLGLYGKYVTVEENGTGLQFDTEAIERDALANIRQNTFDEFFAKHFPN